MQFTDQEKADLEKLEVSLWRAETRFDRSYMDSILADDFFEFGRSGKKYSREECLSAPMQDIKATIPLQSFQIHKITDTVALVTYVSEVQYDELEIGNRSSLWVKTDKSWKLKFHQGTPATSKV